MTQPRRPERLISPSTSRTRSEMYIDTNTRYPQRIPRLIRRPPPSAITTTELDHRPGSISSAISMTREYAIRSDNYQIGPTAVNDLHCTLDEKAVDLSLIREIQIEERPNNRNYVPLKFEIYAEDGGRYSATYRIENVLKNDGSVYW